VTGFLVFGAGIPSRGNVHQVVPGANVLYTDADVKIVAHGAALLALEERVHYLAADATDLSSLDRDALRAALPGWDERPVGVIFLGLAAFLDDDQVAGALAGLFEAVEPGSFLVVDFDGLELSAYPQALALMGESFQCVTRQGFRACWATGGWGPTASCRWRAGGPTASPSGCLTRSGWVIPPGNLGRLH